MSIVLEQEKRITELEAAVEEPHEQATHPR